MKSWLWTGDDWRHLSENEALHRRTCGYTVVDADKAPKGPPKKDAPGKPPEAPAPKPPEAPAPKPPEAPAPKPAMKADEGKGA